MNCKHIPGGCVFFRGLVGAACIAVIGYVSFAAWEKYNKPAWPVVAQDVPEPTLLCWRYRRNMELAGRGFGIEQDLKEFSEELSAECAKEPDMISQTQLLKECLSFKREFEENPDPRLKNVFTALLENCPS